MCLRMRSICEVNMYDSPAMLENALRSLHAVTAERCVRKAPSAKHHHS